MVQPELFVTPWSLYQPHCIMFGHAHNSPSNPIKLHLLSKYLYLQICYVVVPDHLHHLLYILTLKHTSTTYLSQNTISFYFVWAMHHVTRWPTQATVFKEALSLCFYRHCSSVEWWRQYTDLLLTLVDFNLSIKFHHDSYMELLYSVHMLQQISLEFYNIDGYARLKNYHQKCRFFCAVAEPLSVFIKAICLFFCATVTFHQNRHVLSCTFCEKQTIIVI